MKPEKSLNEASFRAQRGPDSNQHQKQPHGIDSKTYAEAPSTTTSHENQLNESHKKIMQSWMNLRRMDKDLAESGKL